MKNEEIQRRDKVLHRTGITSNSTLYYLIQEGLFPRPVKLGKRSVGWKKSDVDAWIDSREYSINTGGTSDEQ